MFQDNDWYGHRTILLNYCNINKNYNVLSSIQHGWNNFGPRRSLGKRKLKRFIPFLCWSKEVKKMMNLENKKNTHIIGSPFVYLHELKKNEKFTSKGTLVFPSHSTPEVNVEINHKKLIDLVEREESGPYTVCLYYTDYKKKIITIYKKKNWNIVCCGNRVNKDFLYILYGYLRSANNVICTELTSPLFYSMFLKKKTRIISHYNENGKIHPLNKIEAWDMEVEGNNYFKKKYPKIFQEGLSLKMGKKLADTELGTNYLKSKKFIKKIMGLDNFIKIILTKFLAFLIDLKEGSNLREGKAKRRKYTIKEYNNLFKN